MSSLDAPLVGAATVGVTAVHGAPDHATQPVAISKGPSTAEAPDQKAPNDTKKFGPRHRGNKIPNVDSTARTGLASILKITGRIPLYNRDNFTPNIFVPSGLTLFYVLHLMDRTMAMTHRFLQGAPLWNPFLSQAYIGLLWIVHIFRIERAAGHFVASHDAFLTAFLNFRGLDTLVVPGPLVPFFESLGLSSPYSDQLDDVFASLADEPDASGNDGFTLSDNQLSRVPNILAALDQYYRIIESVNASAGAGDNRPIIDTNNFHGYVPSNMFRAGAGTQNVDRAMVSPNLRWSVPVTANVINTNRAHSNLFPFASQGTVDAGPAVGGITPTVPTRRYRIASFANANALTWAQYTGLSPVGTRAVTQWLGPASAIMQRYCEFFKDSTTLGRIPVTSVAANQVKVRYTAVSGVNQAVPALGTYIPPANLTCVMEHAHPGMIAIPLPVQIAAITQINSTGHLDDNNIRAGPLWDVIPNVQATTGFDLSVSMDAHVAAHYHTDTRIN